MALAIVLAVLLVPIPAPPASAAPLGENLVANPGFEYGVPTTPTGWTVCCSSGLSVARAQRLPYIGLNDSFGLALEASSSDVVSVLRSNRMQVEGSTVAEFGGTMRNAYGALLRVDFYSGSAFLTFVDAAPAVGVDWGVSRGRVLIPPRATHAQLVIAVDGPTAAMIDDVFFMQVTQNLFTEEWSAGLAGWTTSALGASTDCAVAVNGCALRVDPPTAPPSGTLSDRFYAWPSASTWYRAVLSLDYASHTAYAQVRSSSGALLGTSGTMPLQSGATLDWARFATADYTGATHALHHDDFVIRETGGNVLVEDPFDAGLAPWRATIDGATSDCAVAVSGCSLKLDAPCCGQLLWVTRSLNLTLPTRTEISFAFRSTSTSGSSDDDFSVMFTDGTYFVLGLTDPPSNNNVRLTAGGLRNIPLWVTRSMNATLPSSTEVSFFYRGSATSGATDADFSMTFADGSYAIVRLTDAPGNSMVSLETSAGGIAPVYSWGTANAWYRIVLRLDFAADQARVEVRDFNDLVLASSTPLAMGSVPTLDFMRHASADHAGSTSTFHFDRLVIREDVV